MGRKKTEGFLAWIHGTKTDKGAQRKVNYELERIDVLSRRGANDRDAELMAKAESETMSWD